MRQQFKLVECADPRNEREIFWYGNFNEHLKYHKWGWNHFLKWKFIWIILSWKLGIIRIKANFIVSINAYFISGPIILGQNSFFSLFQIPFFSEYFDFFNELFILPISGQIYRINENKIAQRQYFNQIMSMMGESMDALSKVLNLGNISLWQLFATLKSMFFFSELN